MGLFHQWIDRDKFKEIFRSHWESFKETYSRYRAGRYDEAVQKMLGCGDPNNGYATYISVIVVETGRRCHFPVRVVFVCLAPKYIRINGQLVSRRYYFQG